MHPELRAHAARQGGVFTTDQALRTSYTKAQVRHLVQSGEWIRLRRGVLAEASLVVATDARADHLLRAAAVLSSMTHNAWLSHHTAALAHRLPLLGSPPEDVALTLERQHRRRCDGVQLHTAVTPSTHRASVGVLPVTSVARTISDLARSRPLTDSVVVADAALHQGLCGVDDLAAVIADCPVWPGIARTKRVLDVADRRSESPGESLSRLAFISSGLPVPDLQVELLLGGRRVRVDFMWVERGLVGEFDGRVKYGDAEDLWLEKQREDLIRRHGYRVVRWIWSEVYPRPDTMLARVASML